MNISAYISELLYEHDCVIIPAFGGFVCNYKPAEINAILSTISPPSKAISFNRNLRANDGLLVNYIAEREKISFDEAFASVYAWANSSNNLLAKGEEIILSKVGKFRNNIEGNLQFTPDESVNYLKTSFGLRTIKAEPIIREKQKVLKEEPKVIPIQRERNIWRIAAAIFLIAALATVLGLMKFGVEIKPLNADEASVFKIVSNIFKTHEAELQPIEIKTTSSENITVTPLDVEEIQPVILSERYYIIVGAFAKQKNVDAATTLLQGKFAADDILVEKSGRLTRVGYYAGGKLSVANSQLQLAQQENSSYWLLKK